MTPLDLPVVTTTSDERLWAAAAHGSTLLGYVVPFGNLAGPVVVWLVKKDSSEFVAKHALQALNFQIVALFAMLVFSALACFLIGIPLLLALTVATLVFTIQGVVAAADGREYTYPIDVEIV